MNISALTSLSDRLDSLLTQVLRLRPAQLFITLWVISALPLLQYRYDVVMPLALLLGVIILSAITALNTQSNPPAIETIPAERRKLYAQLIVIGVILALTVLGSVQYHGFLSRIIIPVWTPMIDALEQFSGATFGNDNYVSNPVQYFVIPLILLLLLGAKLPDLGFGRGHRVLRVTLIWCALPVLAILYLLLSGALLSWAARMLISNTLQNGFFEEFLFRGALQTRLRRLMSPAWALVLQALIFGLWHIGLGYANFGDPGGIITAVASTVLYQAVLGIAFGFIFERSRNLIAPSLFHVLYKTMFAL
jgi:membrane protease YdiL (CAAX protease family)